MQAGFPCGVVGADSFNDVDMGLRDDFQVGDEEDEDD